MKQVPVQDVSVRMLVDVQGTFHNHEGVRRGDVLTLPPTDALRYEYFGYCEPADADNETQQQHQARVKRTAAEMQRYLAEKNAESAARFETAWRGPAKNRHAMKGGESPT